MMCGILDLRYDVWNDGFEVWCVEHCSLVIPLIGCVDHWI